MKREISLWGAGPSIGRVVVIYAAVAGVATWMWPDACLITAIPYSVFLAVGIGFRVGEVPYSDPSLCEDWEGLDGRRVKLGHLLKQGHQQFEYVYDFGDCWQHIVEIESAFQPEEGANFPVCIQGVGNCPPEDVGGSIGYAEFLRSINDLDDAKRKNYLEWVGGWFDPDAFDLKFVNRVLTRMSG